MPLNRPNRRHMPESRFALGLCASLMGGVVGGVVGLSFEGLSVLPLSSVMPGPLPEAEAAASMLEEDHVDSAGDEVRCDCLTLIGALFITLYDAGLFVSIEGGL